MAIVGSIAFVFLFLVVGTLAACVVTMLLGVAGMPGSMVAALIRKGNSAAARTAGIFIAVPCQSYVALAFAAMIIESARPIVERSTGFWTWFFWALVIFVASEPGAIAVKSVASHHKDSNADPLTTFITTNSAALTSSINLAGSIIFAIFPSVISWGWGWVPHF
jgi:hypothetical protein